MPENSYPLEQVGAYRITCEGLREVVLSVEKFTKDGYQISATFDDNFVHSNEDVDKFISHPYFRSNIANKITIRSSNIKYTVSGRKYIDITFKKRSGAGVIEASISSQDDDLHIIRADLSREIKSFRTSYDLIYRLPEIIWFVLMFIFGIYIAVWVIAPYFREIAELNKQAHDNIGPVSMIIGMSVSILSFYISNKIKRYIFPSFTVSIGKADEKFKSKADNRKWIYRLILGAGITYLATKVYSKIYM